MMGVGAFRAARRGGRNHDDRFPRPAGDHKGPHPSTSPPPPLQNGLSIWYTMHEEKMFSGAFSITKVLNEKTGAELLPVTNLSSMPQRCRQHPLTKPFSARSRASSKSMMMKRSRLDISVSNAR